MSDKGWAQYLEGQIADGNMIQDEIDNCLHKANYLTPPKTIHPVPQLRDDAYALFEFFTGETPPVVQDRNKNVQVVRYGFGDASGTGFGSLVQTQAGIRYRVGVWGSDDEEESSNYKEFENIVNAIEEEINAGRLTDSVLFFFTDNSKVESALCKGNSKSRKLFELVVRFRQLQFTSGIQVVESHVAGSRMIEQGKDGVSRGCMREGVAATGMGMLDHVPLHLSCCQRHPAITNWLTEWIRRPKEILTPSEWFTRGHEHAGGRIDERNFWRVDVKPGIFVWTPTPGAAMIAVEELRKSVLKRQTSTHIFLCPRLLTTEWRKQLKKTCDLVLFLPPGRDSKGWP
jgi:hypothetical protein